MVSLGQGVVGFNEIDKLLVGNRIGFTSVSKDQIPLSLWPGVSTLNERL